MGTMTGYPSIDKPWLKYYSEEAIHAPIPEGTIYEYLWENNKDYLNDVALIYFGKKINYKTLFEKIEIVENALKFIGVRYGDIVTISLPSIPEAVYLQYALNKIGAIANMIDPRSDSDMLKYYLDEAQSEVFIFLDKCIPIVQKIIGQTGVKTAVCVSATETLPLINFLGKLTGTSNKMFQAISWKTFISSKAKTYQMNERDTRVSKDTPALMTHTSGTTGKPKGVVLSNYNINAVAHQYEVSIRQERGQRYLCVIPPFIAFGICVAIHMPMTLGISSVLIPQFDPNDFMKILKKYKPAHLVCTPSNYEGLIHSKSKADLSFLISPGAGGDNMEVNYENEINTYLEKHNCSHKTLKGYGMTEVSSSACTCWDNCNKPGSVGIPLVNMTISVFKIGTTTELTYGEEGEICFTGPNVMQGYFKNTEATNAALKKHEDGTIWMHSGDIGYMTQEGYVFVIDRMKRVVVIDTHMIMPSKIERVLMRHSNIKKCAVFANEKLDLIASVVLKENDRTSETEKELRELCTMELPQYSQPAKYMFRDNLPLTPVGKVDFRALEEEENKISHKKQ